MPRALRSAFLFAWLLPATAWADPLTIKAVMSPKEQIYADLPTPQRLAGEVVIVKK